MHQVIIMGAGWCGLVAGKTYLQAEPSADLLIIDSDSTLGGTWSRDRLYPGLVAEAHYGLFEYSDLPMDSEGIGSDGLIPGSSVHRYLTEYAKKFDLINRLRLNSKVQTITRSHARSPWILRLANSDEVLACEKLIIATGLTSEPFLPRIPNESFCGEVLHTKELGKSETVVKINRPSIRRVLVYGGSKSAFDAVHMLLRAGKHVEWVIRNGNGPSIMTPLTVLGRPSFQLSNSRLLGMFSPTIFDTASTWHRVFHGPRSAWFGPVAVKAFWMIMTYLLERPSQYWKTENGRNLEPNMGLKSLLWSPATLGVMTHPDLWEDIHRGDRVTVHRKTIESFSQADVCFHDGSKLQADLVILATGWKTMHSSFSEEDRLEIGLPSTISFGPQLQTRWSALETEAESVVERTFPLFAEAPEGGYKDSQSSYRLYRHIVPTSFSNNNRSLAFIGMLRTAGAPLVYEAQALWAVAYLTGKLRLPSKAEMERDVATTNAWIQKRYVCGRKVPFALFDFMQYIDLLYSDVGVMSQRKGNKLAEIFCLYTPADFKGVVNEWLHNEPTKRESEACSAKQKTYSQGWTGVLTAMLVLVILAGIIGEFRFQAISPV